MHFKFKKTIENIVLELNKMVYEEDERFSRDTSPVGFELLVVEAIKNIQNVCHSKFEIDYNKGSHGFPDIIIKFIGGEILGVEVKSSTRKKASSTSWTTLGNSILGSTRKKFDDVYIIYIKVGDNGTFIKSARYEDAVSDVVVTHSPRYKLDLGQSKNDSFFCKSGISYEKINKSADPIGLITDYFREQGYTEWWIAESTPAAIINWTELDEIIQDEIKAQAFVLFPELIYSNSPQKYNRFSKWLVVNYSVVDSSLRDRFSAGGRRNLKIKRKVYENMPRVYQIFQKLQPTFVDKMKNVSMEELEKYWNTCVASDDSILLRLDCWFQIVKQGLECQPNGEKYIQFLNDLFAEIETP